MQTPATLAPCLNNKTTMLETANILYQRWRFIINSVAYEIATVNGDKYFYYTKNDPTIFFYHKNKEVGSSDIKMMIKYLNNHNDGNKVNKIIKNVKVVDERKTASKN